MTQIPNPKTCICYKNRVNRVCVLFALRFLNILNMFQLVKCLMWHSCGKSYLFSRCRSSNEANSNKSWHTHKACQWEAISLIQMSD